MNLEKYFEQKTQQVEAYLKKFLASQKSHKTLQQAVHYALFSGGKRIRPILAIACAEAVGARTATIFPGAAALECIHAYSLVHDDLPCMDNDDYRRGKWTVHKKYGEATAVLVGDALLTYAFELLTQVRPAGRSVEVAQLLSKAAGMRGMIGGQFVDKLYENRKRSLAVMDYINIHKTGKLLAASCLIGAVLGGANATQKKAALHYGEHLGLVFQLIDDIIDNDGYARYIGKPECLRRAESLTRSALQSAGKLPHHQETLKQIALFILNRRK